MNKPDDVDPWTALRFDLGDVFTPSQPVALRELFSGRQEQVKTLLETVSERGRHAIIYGEPGVGKTSIAQVLKYMIPVKASSVKYFRKAAFSSDSFSSIWLDIFRQMKFASYEDGIKKEYLVSDLYEHGVTPNDVVRELQISFTENDIPIIVIDEYNLISDNHTSQLMAETIKSVSDSGLKVTIVVVGVSDNVGQLIAGHSSIVRCTEEILMPRMQKQEVNTLLESRVRNVGMRINGDAKWKIINLCKGLPSFAHSLGKEAALAAISSRRRGIHEDDVDKAIIEILKGSQRTLGAAYDLATHSNQSAARYRQILTACSLVDTDDFGYFMAKQVQQPLTALLNRQVGIENYNDNLKDFTEEKRGKVLQSKGTARMRRYRFSNPAMQPHVIMKAIQDGILDSSAKNALSRPEQPDLFPSAS